MAEAKAAAKEVADLRSKLAVAQVASSAEQAATTPSGARVLVLLLDGVDAGSLQVPTSVVIQAYRVAQHRDGMGKIRAVMYMHAC